MDGAQFHIVLVDETTSTATSEPVRTETPPSPAPARPDPAPSSNKPAPSPTKTDRPAPVAETRATPANEQADRAPTKDATSKKTPEEKEHEKHVDAVKDATRIVIDSTHLRKSFDPILDTIASTRKVFDGVLSAIRIYRTISDRADGLSLKRENREAPKSQTKTDRPVEPVAKKGSEQPEPQPVEKPKLESEKPDDFLFPEERPSKPDPKPESAANVGSKPSKPEPTKQTEPSWFRSMLNSMLEGISGLLDEPGVDPVREDTDNDPSLKKIDANTDPSHIANAATRIVDAIKGTAEAAKKDAPIKDDSGNAIEDLHANSVKRDATKEDEWLFDEFNTPYRPGEAKPNYTAPKPEKESPDDFLFGKKEAEKPSAPQMPDVGTVRNVAKAVEGGEAGAVAETAVAAEGAAAGEAVAAAEATAALEAGATRAAGGLARLAAAMGPPGWAAAAVAVALASVAAGAYAVYKAFDKIGDAAAKQADELEGYSADIAKQRAETDVRRQMRLIDRAQERGATLARVGETKDRLDEAINNLKDVVTDRFVDLGERMIPAIETLTGYIENTANFVEAIGTACSVIEATVVDWTNSMGDEAAENKRWNEAWELHNKKVEKFLGKQDKREEEARRAKQGKLMENLLVNAFGPPQAIDPAVMKQLVDKLRAL